MLRLVQTSDVHLGARHPMLGERAAEQRERQFAAFEQVVELAAGDPGRPVPRRRRPVRLERPVAGARRARRRRSFKKLVAAGIPVVLILPGDGDAPGRASIYHVHDLRGWSAKARRPGSLTVLTDGDART